MDLDNTSTDQSASQESPKPHHHAGHAKANAKAHALSCPQVMPPGRVPSNLTLYGPPSILTIGLITFALRIRRKVRGIRAEGAAHLREMNKSLLAAQWRESELLGANETAKKELAGLHERLEQSESKRAEAESGASALRERLALILDANPEAEAKAKELLARRSEEAAQAAREREKKAQAELAATRLRHFLEEAKRGN